MTGKVIDIDAIIQPDNLARELVDKFISWDIARRNWLDQKVELRNYLFATSTVGTTNETLPWKNKTHRPKLTQIRDNLHANYMSALFPKRNWFQYIGNNEEEENKEKRRVIEAYVSNKVRLSEFVTKMSRLVLDYIDYGNAFAQVDFVRKTITDTGGEEREVYVGPVLNRISPYDIVFNPLAPDFINSPKMIRNIVSLGEIKKIIEEQPERGYLADVFTKIVELRRTLQSEGSDDFEKNEALQIDGFSNFHEYLSSGMVELIQVYGDIYDVETGEYKKNRIITIADRSYVLQDEEIQTYSGNPAIFHAGWRLRPDNLYAMGPLDNLVGLQYRLDHLENLKADVFDLIAFPPLKIIGDVSDFRWGPLEKIYIAEDGDVTTMQLDTAALNADLQIAEIERTMEEMAGAPREAMGIRTPGEKTAFEVDVLQNAASRVFRNKVQYFEEIFVEPILNAFLEIGRRNLDTVDQIRIFDEETDAAVFQSITREDLTATGAIRAIGARHFAEKAETVQNLVNFMNSGVGQDEAVKAHFSGFKIAKMMEDLLDLQAYDLVSRNVRLMEAEETQRLANSAEQGLAEEDLTSGLETAQLQLP
jgi:hypothetical protein